MARRYASLIEFQRRFPDEASCALFLFGRRWPDGFTCRACRGTRSWPLDSRAYTHECRACGRQTSVTAGTFMHRTKLPPTRWFWDDVVLGGPLDGDALQRHVGAAVDGPTGPWLLQDRLAARAEAAAIDGRSQPRSAGGRGRGGPDRDAVANRRRSRHPARDRQDHRHRCRRSDRPGHREGAATQGSRAEVSRHALGAHPARGPSQRPRHRARQ